MTGKTTSSTAISPRLPRFSPLDFLLRVVFPVILLSISGLPAAALDPSQVLVIYNKRVEDSDKLAREYQKLRNIPIDQVIGLDMPPDEEISRADYNSTIRDPIQNLARKHDWWSDSSRLDPGKRKIHAIVSMRGVPLKIRPEPRKTPLPGTSTDAASVDGELATLNMAPKQTEGAVISSYYSKNSSIESSNSPVLLVTRIDAPSVNTCLRMMRDAVETEKSGLWGWSLVDLAQFYPQGDNWLRNIAKTNDAQGIPTYLDTQKPVLPKDFKLPGKIATYYGWYEWNLTGVFQQSGFKFEPGAIAVHIHSFSANTMRNPTANWCGPLLELGAAATLGNVYEPYLQMTHELDIFHDRLLRGYTLAEAAGMSLRTLSWQATVFGDPLYRPFARFDLSALTQAPKDNFTPKMMRLAAQKWGNDPAKLQSKLRDATARWNSDELKSALDFYVARTNSSTSAPPTPPSSPIPNNAKQ